MAGKSHASLHAPQLSSASSLTASLSGGWPELKLSSRRSNKWNRSLWRRPVGRYQPNLLHEWSDHGRDDWRRESIARSEDLSGPINQMPAIFIDTLQVEALIRKEV